MRTKVFDFTRPLTYKGSHYPSTIMDIEDDKGNVASRNVFADANGQYHSLNNDGNAVPIILNPNYKVLVPFGVSTMAMKYHSQDK